MGMRFRGNSWHWLKCLILICSMSVLCAAAAESDLVAALRTKYASITERLHQNQFKRPLVLDSTETPNRLKGDIYAVVNYSFGTVSAGLDSPDHWCDVMLLHINTKYCHAQAGPSGTTLKVNIGKKTPQDLADTTRLEFNYRVAVVTPEYIEFVLNAKDGPMGTSDYRIVLEAVALPDATKTLLHLTYSYALNLSGRLALQVYLLTGGSGKVGFSVVGASADGRPVYVGGGRGLMERNTMRYYLAIDSYLNAGAGTPETQFEKRLQSWFTAAERYPRQLHEIDRAEYLDMKRAEYLRQQTVH